MGEAEKFRDSRGDESAEANERPRRETEEEAPPAGPAGAGTAQGAPRDIWEPGQPREHPGTFGSRDSPGSTETSGSTGISQEASRTLGDPGTSQGASRTFRGTGTHRGAVPGPSGGASREALTTIP